MELRKYKSSPHVLVVDDESSFTMRTSMILRCAGYRVSVAASGEDALDLLINAALTPSLILLDLAMPGMDGWRFREIQKAHSKFWHIPVVVLGDAPMKPEYAATLEAAALLIKPVERAELLKTLARVLNPQRKPPPLTRNARSNETIVNQ